MILVQPPKFKGAGDHLLAECCSELKEALAQWFESASNG